MLSRVVAHRPWYRPKCIPVFEQAVVTTGMLMNNACVWLVKADLFIDWDKSTCQITFLQAGSKWRIGNHSLVWTNKRKQTESFAFERDATSLRRVLQVWPTHSPHRQLHITEDEARYIPVIDFSSIPPFLLSLLVNALYHTYLTRKPYYSHTAWESSCTATQYKWHAPCITFMASYIPPIQQLLVLPFDL